MGREYEDDPADDPRIFGVGIRNDSNLIGSAQIYLESLSNLLPTEIDETILIDRQGNQVGNII